MESWTHPNENEWQQVEKRVKKISSSDIETLCCAISKYHYYGGPCDWKPEWNNEEIMLNWAKWIVKNAEKEEIDELIDDYTNGSIPDAFSLMIQYFD